MLIERSSLNETALAGKTVLLTGGGGGIGYETARALVWLGANVIVAEVDTEKGKAAEEKINGELGCARAEFYPLDLSDEAQIDALIRHAKEKHGFVDVVFNNATVTPLGAVGDVPASEWDKSYAVNLRAPLLLTQKLLPDMRQKNSGTIIFVSSSGAAPYMGAYEVFKTAQVELSNTLAGELESTGVNVFTIGPGLVRTDTAINGIKRIAAMMGMSTEEFYKMNEAHMLSPEEAGVGFALAVVYAEKYNGQEVSSTQVLHETGIIGEVKVQETGAAVQNGGILKPLIEEAVKTYDEQYDGWLARNLFERQWVFRDFKKYVGHSAEQFKAILQNIRTLAQNDVFDEIVPFKSEFEKLQQYYQHQYDLLQGFEKDPEKLKTNSAVIIGWVENVRSISEQL
jgi:NAD(P)-dependent dehydrogenase (short-subunit alcohol dehydrogenase family)